jgi:hypothetical protein
MRALWQKPPIAVGLVSIVLIAGFVWHGELRVAPAGERTTLAAAKPPTVVRRERADGRDAGSTHRGRVFDTRGFLRVGVECVPMQHAAVRTDADGWFRFTAPRGHCVDVLVRGDGLLSRWLQSSDGAPDELLAVLAPRAPWDAEPTPPPERVALRGEGMVRGGDGRPLAGAYVTAIDSGVWTRTDELGRYALPLPGASVTLLVHDAHELPYVGGQAVRGEPFVSPRVRGSVPLPELVAGPAAAIRGIVRDPLGAPIEGVPVQVRGEGLVREVPTGGGGAFRVAGLLPGQYAVTPFAWRGAVGAVTNVTLDRPLVELELRLAQADEVKLRVVDGKGAPVALAHVATAIGGVRRGVAQADEAGYAAVPVGADTEFTVRTAPELAPCPVQRFDAEPPTLVVALP